MEKELPESEKKRFYEVCQMYHLDSQAMQHIAAKAGFSKQVMDAMAVSVAVCRAQATAVLAALSEQTGQTWTLDNVKVVLFPTFAGLHALHQFDLDMLSIASGVSFDIISRMLREEPVPMKQARLVLRAASKQVGQMWYTLDNVDVKTSEEK